MKPKKRSLMQISIRSTMYANKHTKKHFPLYLLPFCFVLPFQVYCTSAYSSFACIMNRSCGSWFACLFNRSFSPLIPPSPPTHIPQPTSLNPNPSTQSRPDRCCVCFSCVLSSFLRRIHAKTLLASFFILHRTPTLLLIPIPLFCSFFQGKDASAQCTSKKGNNLWAPTPPTPLLHGSISSHSLDRLHSNFTLIPINNDPRKKNQ